MTANSFAAPGLLSKQEQGSGPKPQVPVSEANLWQPLANAQLGVFFGHHLNPGSPAFTTAEVVKVAGRLDHSALRDAVSAAYAQFPQLRASFRLSPDGPEQSFAEPKLVALPLLECASELEAEAAITELMAQPLDIYSGEVTRTVLLRLPAQDWWVHAAHHLVMDGYAAHQFVARVRELLSDPASAKVVEHHVEFPNFEAAEALDFWRERLSEYQGSATLAAINAEPSARSIREQLLIPRQLQDLLRNRAQELQTTWGELFTAITGSYLARMLQAPSIRCGLPLMNRTLPGVGTLPQATTVCSAVNVLPVTIPATGTISETVAALRLEQAEIRKHPFTRQEVLARQLNPGTDLFGAQINLIPFERALRFAEHPASITNLSAGPVYDLTITLRGLISRANAPDKELSLELDANPALYSAEQLRWHLDRLLAWIDTVCLAPDDAPLASLPLLSDRERREVSEVFNDTAQNYDLQSPADHLRAQASRTPDAIALDDGQRQLSYAELLHEAESMADELTGLGARAGSVVGVRLERSIRLFVSICALALLEATYLPLDPDLPTERMSAMVSDAGAVAIIDTQSIARTELPIVPSARDGLDQIAYVLFTSGSTGTPKGVAVSQLALDNRLRWMQAELPIGVGDVVLHKTPISFDVSVWELFWPLQEGATVRIAPPGAHRDPRELAPLLDSVTVVHFVPSMLAALLADRAAVEVLQNARDTGRGVACVVTSGEALVPALVDRCVEVLGVAPVNLYGPTEAAIDVTIWRSSAGEAEVPIGVPVPNTQCFVLDDAGDLVPIGVPGELWLGGVQLAAGYVSRPDLTAERFVETRFGRLYRTGDLAAWRCDGALRYLGRNDFQVKLRGQRVELGEIDSLVAAQPGVSQSVVVLCDDQLLCAVVGSADFDDLRSACERKLPASWVPSLWFRMPRLPVSGSGKTDRGAVVAAFRADRSPAELPLERGTRAEERVAAVFAEVSGATPFPITGDFFTHGGDSLRALRLLNVLEDSFGTRVDLATLFANPSPRALLKALPALLAQEEMTRGAQQESSRPELAECLPLRVSAGDEVLFLFPPAGGLGLGYLSLLRHLPERLSVVALQAGSAGGEHPGSLSALAEHYLTLIDKFLADQSGTPSISLAGWSLGGMTAHAVASLIEARGGAVRSVVLLDAYPPEQWQGLPAPSEQDVLHGVLRMGGLTAPSDRVLDMAKVLRYLQESESPLAALDDEMMRSCITNVRHATELVRTPLPATDLGPLAAKVLLISADAPREETWLDATAWRPLTSGAFEISGANCAHGEMLRSTEVGEILARHLAAEPGGPR